MNEIGIVIRTYNEAAFIGRTLDSLLAQTEQSFEIVLVDSGSTDATVEIARRYDRVKIIEINKEEFTYGRALNIGIAAVTESVDYFVMLSAHAIPCDESWLNELVAPMKSDPKVVGVYGKQVVLPEHLSNPIVRLFDAECYPNCYADKAYITKESYFFSNVNAAIRSITWRENRFNESINASEDWYWAKVAITSGGWIAYQPSATVYHSHPDTFCGYFFRIYHEVKSARTIDPLSNPLISKRDCMRRLVNIFIRYCNDSLTDRTLFGLNWDLFRAKAIREFATYKGRKEANIE